MTGYFAQFIIQIGEIAAFADIGLRLADVEYLEGTRFQPSELTYLTQRTIATERGPIIMTYAILGVVFVLMIVAAVYAAKTWHWVNVVFLVLTFLAGVGAAAAMAKVLHLKHQAMRDAVQAEQRAEQLQQVANEAVFGPPDSITYGPNSLRGLSEALKLEMDGRGRVWRNGQIEVQGNNRVFKFGVERPADENQAAASMQDMMLYVFADGIVEDVPYPVTYVGNMRVVSETPDSVVLEPLFIANQEEYENPSGSWTLFEKMPLDRNDAFRRAEGVDINSPEFDITEYRQVLMNKYLPAGLFGLDPESAEYEKIIDTYAFDGLTLGQIENWIEENRATRINPRFEPALEEVFVRFKFNKKSNRKYQVDATGNLNVGTDGLFTPQGYAVLETLHVGGDGSVTFQEGDEVIVDVLTADGYQRSDGTQVPPFSTLEDVTEVARIYIRQRRDYPYILQDLQRETARLTDEIKRVRENNVATQIAWDDATAQVTERDDVIGKLQQDQENLRRDNEAIRQALAQRQLEVDELRQRVAALEQSIREKHARILARKAVSTGTE